MRPEQKSQIVSNLYSNSEINQTEEEKSSAVVALTTEKSETAENLQTHAQNNLERVIPLTNLSKSLQLLELESTTTINDLPDDVLLNIFDKVNGPSKKSGLNRNLLAVNKKFADVERKKIKDIFIWESKFSISVLSRILNRYCALEELRINDENFSSSLLSKPSRLIKKEKPAIAIKTITSLTFNGISKSSHLSFSRNSLSSKGLIALLSIFPKLKHLDLPNRKGIVDEDIIPVLEYLGQECQNSRLPLNSIILGCSKKLTDKSVISISNNLTGLTELNLSGCKTLTDKSIISIAKNMTGLIKLHLSGCTGITKSSVVEVVKYCKNLKYLYLSHNENWTDEDIAEIVAHGHNLVILDLSKCYRVWGNCIISISQFCNNLEQLYINTTAITSRPDLLPDLIDQCKNLKNINSTNITR